MNAPTGPVEGVPVPTLEPAPQMSAAEALAAQTEAKIQEVLARAKANEAENVGIRAEEAAATGGTQAEGSVLTEGNPPFPESSNAGAYVEGAVPAQAEEPISSAEAAEDNVLESQPAEIPAEEIPEKADGKVGESSESPARELIPVTPEDAVREEARPGDKEEVQPEAKLKGQTAKEYLQATFEEGYDQSSPENQAVGVAHLEQVRQRMINEKGLEPSDWDAVRKFAADEAAAETKPTTPTEPTVAGREEGSSGQTGERAPAESEEANAPVTDLAADASAVSDLGEGEVFPREEVPADAEAPTETGAVVEPGTAGGEQPPVEGKTSEAKREPEGLTPATSMTPEEVTEKEKADQEAAEEKEFMEGQIAKDKSLQRLLDDYYEANKIEPEKRDVSKVMAELIKHEGDPNYMLSGKEERLLRRLREVKGKSDQAKLLEQVNDPNISQEKREALIKRLAKSYETDRGFFAQWGEKTGEFLGNIFSFKEIAKAGEQARNYSRSIKGQNEALKKARERGANDAAIKTILDNISRMKALRWKARREFIGQSLLKYIILTTLFGPAALAAVIALIAAKAMKGLGKSQ